MEERNCFNILVVSDSEMMYQPKFIAAPRETDKLNYTHGTLILAK